MFHRIILQAAQNPILEEFLDNLHYRCARLWSSSLSQVVPNEDILNQMKNIYQAFVEEDAKSAGLHMAQHIHYFIEKIKMNIIRVDFPTIVAYFLGRKQKMDV